MMDWGTQKAARSVQDAADSLNHLTKSRSDQDDRFENDTSIPEYVKKKTLEDRERGHIPPKPMAMNTVRVLPSTTRDAIGSFSGLL